MKIIFTIVVAVSIFFSASPSFGQTVNGIPAVNFVCLQSEPLFDIMNTSYNFSPEKGQEVADNYIEKGECWQVNPTPVEIIKILKEVSDPNGKLWAVVSVIPHKMTGYTKRPKRFAVIDAEIAQAYLAKVQNKWL